MPRVLSSEACLTCRKRKLKCDENVPICNRCKSSGRYCNRSQDVKFRLYEHPKPADAPSPDPQNPADALKDPLIARLFHHYITELAPWYDLSDADQHFSRSVPQKALTSPLLFSAVIAFAAIHSSCTVNVSMRSTAEFYHSSCIEHLIALNESTVQSAGDVALAAVCLLRSYEIQAEDFDPNRHLSGAYAIAGGQTIDLRSSSLFRAGFFNFLREDITFALMNHCALKIDPEKLNSGYTPVTDEDQLNIVTLILGQAINASFSKIDRPREREEVASKLRQWKQMLPSSFQPIHDSFIENTPISSFPSIYMLHNSHVSAIQYSIVAECVLASAGINSSQEDVLRHLENLAIRLCALAFTADDASVAVNTFGPISFCCGFITNKYLQDGLVRRLVGLRRQTGWPLQRMADSLESHWRARDRRPICRSAVQDGASSN